MASLDVSQLLTDPTFVDAVTIIHREVLVDDLGQTQTTSQSQCTVGSVQPASGKTISRLPDDLRVADVREFFVKGKIISDGGCKYPDLLVFQGQSFEVQIVFPWSNFGLGYCEGIAVRKRAA